MEYFKKVTFSFCKGFNAEGKFSLGKEDYEALKQTVAAGKNAYLWINEKQERKDKAVSIAYSAMKMFLMTLLIIGAIVTIAAYLIIKYNVIILIANLFYQ